MLLQHYDMVYVSQITYLTQRTLVPDIGALVTALSDALSQPPTASLTGVAGPAPLVLVDGYHGFGAIPTHLHPAFSCPAVASGWVLHARIRTDKI
jgi:hypothetical protein